MDYCHVIICITVIQIKSSVACTHQPPPSDPTQKQFPPPLQGTY